MKIMLLNILCCPPPPERFPSLADISSLANIVIAILTLCLGFYVFVYQRRKDAANKIELDEHHKKSIKIQWYKEIIIEPRIDNVFKFYEKLNSYRLRFSAVGLSESDRIGIISEIKLEQSTLRKSFLDLIQHIDRDLYESLMGNLDALTDNITDVASNTKLNLSDTDLYEKNIEIPIQKSCDDFLSKVFNYCG